MIEQIIHYHYYDYYYLVRQAIEPSDLEKNLV